MNAIDAYGNHKIEKKTINQNFPSLKQKLQIDKRQFWWLNYYQLEF